MPNLALVALLVVSAAPLPDDTTRFAPAPCPFEASAEVLASIDCGYVTVPENWAEPAARAIAIPVAVLRATAPEPRPDPHVLINGGPMPVLEGAARMAASPVRRDRDLVLFDYRGMGYGEPVCPGLGEAYRRVLARPLGAAESLEERRRVARECRAWSEENGVDLGAYNARNMARDVIAIVEALGYAEWNVDAISFGTVVAQEIMRLHPSGLRAVALSGPVAPDAESIELNGFRRSLELMAAYCLRDRACAAAYPDPVAAYEALFDGLEREPLRVPQPRTGPSPDDALYLSGTLLQFTVHQMLYSRAFLARIPMLIDATARGDLAPFAAVAAAMGERATRLSGTNWAAQCDASRAWAEADAPAHGHPAYSDYYRAELRGRCEALGVEAAPAEARVPVESDVPTLILTGEHDPVTPPVYGEAVARELGRVYTIEVPGHGHSIPTSCTVPLLLDFFERPERMPAATCFETLPDVPFVTRAVSGPGA